MSGECSESDLIHQAVAGDRASLSQLLLIHYDGLRRHIAARISNDLQGVLRPDDVLQQTFVRVAQTIGAFQLRHERAFRGWLETIAENIVKDAAKRRRRERRAPDRQVRRASAGDDSSVAAVVERIAADCTTPGRRVQRSESIRRMRAAIASLPDDQREVVERYYMQGQSYEQIAEAVGRSKDAIRGVCYRARKNLRAMMGRSSLYFSG
jgi:RNA polymerase sigma-70 factor (ECF subfamily)